MSKHYFTHHGWSGLTTKGKFLALGLGVLFALVSLFLLPLVFEGMTLQRVIKKVFKADVLVLAWAIGVGFVCAAVAHLFLPKQTFYQQDYYCAACGQYLGSAPERCDRCGSNRYTTEDPGGRR